MNSHYDALRSNMDHTAAQRDGWMRKNAYYYRSIERFINLQIPANASVLEVGCSNGLALKRFQNEGFKTYGIDISEIATRYASEKFGVWNVVQGDILDIPFKDNLVDAIFSCDVLEHLHPKDLDKAIDELVRVTNNYLF